MSGVRIEQNDINKVAWRACEIFRGVIEPAEYKNYILVMLFLKYLSDVWKDRLEKATQEFGDDQERVARRMSLERFVLPPNSSFDFLLDHCNEPKIGELINIALKNIERENKARLDSVFRTVDFNSEAALGKVQDRNRRLRQLLEHFAILDLRPSRIGDSKVIVNTYEYLISRFASDSGKKGGEFYTPHQVSVLLAKLLQPKSGSRICDPACGSGSLLIRIADEVADRNCELYGQESNGSTWALCRMNMFLHGKDSARIEWGDALNDPRLIEGDSLMKFDVVVANPPFLMDKWGAENAPMDEFNRFYRGIPPKNKADYAFISHMVETSVEATGRVGVIVPHGVLFRSGAEGEIRRNLIEENLLEAVIGLPANLFFGVGIPAVIMLFNRGKQTTDVLFIDASNDYEQGKNQNKLHDGVIARIVKTFNDFHTVEKYAYRATFEEIKRNEFNLNISRYVHTFEEEKPVDLKQVKDEIEQLEKELDRVRLELSSHLSELSL
jgi:type I restriction enzyme M protein